MPNTLARQLELDYIADTNATAQRRLDVIRRAYDYISTPVGMYETQDGIMRRVHLTPSAAYNTLLADLRELLRVEQRT